MAVVIETTLGDITVDLYVTERPRTCLNFLKLCKVKFYNFCTFHKIERNFVAQTGDPTGTGRGGQSVFCMLYGEQAKYFDAEMTPRLKHKKLGTLSMVNNGDNVHGSQFFITLGEDLDYLDGVHTVFGEVTEGFDVLVKLNDAICDEEHRPFQDILITHTVILDDPFDDPKELLIPDHSPEPTEEQLKSSRIGATEDIDDTKGKSLEEIEEEIKIKEAKARATILEMIGDIPDAEVKPPDNVLFVCKLNPVTTAEDLEVIFSRFGVIKSCEVICDRKTGESLQYAFIEFEKPEDCENAYFKMDNVLIDDRRIHVDFSQSVSKLKWKGRESGNMESQNKKQDYVIKEKAQSRKDDRYQMVFDEDVVAAPVEIGYVEDKEGHKRTKKKRKKKKNSGSESDSSALDERKKKREKGEKMLVSSDSENMVRNKDMVKDNGSRKVQKSKSSDSEDLVKTKEAVINKFKGKTDKDSKLTSSDSEDGSSGTQKKKTKLPAHYRNAYSNESKESSKRESSSSDRSPRTPFTKPKPSEEQHSRHTRLHREDGGHSHSRSRSRSRSYDHGHQQSSRQGRDSRTATDRGYSSRFSPHGSRTSSGINRYEEKSQSRKNESNSKKRSSRSPSKDHRQPDRGHRRSSKDRRHRSSRSSGCHGSSRRSQS